MNTEDIIRMALEAGILDSRDWLDAPFAQDVIADLERFAALVAAAEREACAKLADERLMDTSALISSRTDCARRKRSMLPICPGRRPPRTLPSARVR